MKTPSKRQRGPYDGSWWEDSGDMLPLALLIALIVASAVWGVAS